MITIDNLWGLVNATFEGVEPVYANYKFFNEDGRKVLKVYIPGIKKENLSLKIEKNSYLCVVHKGEPQFTRKFWIDEDTDAEKISAKYEDGVLEVSLPERESFTKTISIE